MEKLATDTEKLDTATEELDTEYIKHFEKLEVNYNKFYNKIVKNIKLFYIYINEDNEVYNIKKENETLENSYLTKERILYLIKNNQYNCMNKHKLVSLLQFNIDLKYTDLNNFILHKINDNYLSSLKILDNIKFKDTIGLLTNLNSIFFIYNYVSRDNKLINTTKKIMIKSNKSKCKTRRK